MSKPLVSIIIPTFNSERTIKLCLESIRRQTYPNIETIIVDEFSKDQTAGIAKKYATIYSVKGERSVARNFGIEKAHGDYVLVIDSDMELSPSVVEECVSQAKDYDAIIIPEVSVGEGFWTKCRILERRCYWGESWGDEVIEAARFFPKKLVQEIGGYDPAIVGAEDWDLHQRVRKAGYKIGRVKSQIIHHEGKISFIKSIKKKMYYGQAFNLFRERYPDVFKKAVLRTAFLKRWRLLVKDPIHASGVFIMKLGEGLGLWVGMMLAKRRAKVAHYQG